MEDKYARLLGQFDGLPDTLATKDTTIRVVSPFGLEGSSLYVVKTVRMQHRDEDGRVTKSEDTVFLEVYGDKPEDRFRGILPPAVTEAIARQRDALTDKSRAKGAKRRAEGDKAAGIAPGFLRGKKKR
jgi:hypothetical protein